MTAASAGCWIRSSPTDEAGRWATDLAVVLGVLPGPRGRFRDGTKVQLEQPSVSRAAQGVRIYPYGVNRNKIEQFVRGLPAMATISTTQTSC